MKNQVAFTYNDLGQVTKSEQAHEGVVGMGTRSVQYAFDTSAASSVFSNGARLESVTYPSGRVIFNDYGSANTLTDLYHLPYRLRETNAAGTILTEYSWTGTRKMVIADYPAPDFKLDLFRGTTGTYAGLDRFARTIDQFWDGYGATADVDRFKYAYDYAGNRTYRDIDAAIYATNNKDHAYAYDSLHRLITSDQGTLSGSTISGTPVREEDFTLDALGNWSNYLTKASGTTDLNQARTHNDANEITQIDASSTHIAHDAAGNTTKAPKPTAWSSHFDLIYDPWNRLVQVNDGANTVAVYRYDGRNYRLTKAVYASGVLSYTDHTYYNDAWQALEVRRETSGVEDADPREQFVWHPDYIDSLAVRYFDADTDGNLAESSDGPHYYAQDVNYNVTAIVTASGTVLERYQYDPYGRLTVLDANFATDADGLSDVDNATTYTGRLFDAESGRYYFRNRYYDPVTGRFASRDPLEYLFAFSLYEYVGGVPVSHRDPFGLGPWWGQDFVWPWDPRANWDPIANLGGYGSAAGKAIVGGLAGAGAGAATGGAAGAVFGGVSGSLAGGIGAIPGAVGGAGVGALGGAIWGGIGGVLGSSGAQTAGDAATAGAGYGALTGGLGGLGGAWASGAGAAAAGGAGISGAGAAAGAATAAAAGTALQQYSPAQLAQQVGMTIPQVNTVLNAWFHNSASLIKSTQTINALLAYRLIAIRNLADRCINEAGKAEQARRLDMINQQLQQWGLN